MSKYAIFGSRISSIDILEAISFVDPESYTIFLEVTMTCRCTNIFGVLLMDHYNLHRTEDRFKQKIYICKHFNV